MTLTKLFYSKTNTENNIKDNKFVLKSVEETSDILTFRVLVK